MGATIAYGFIVVCAGLALSLTIGSLIAVAIGYKAYERGDENIMPLVRCDD